MARISLTFILIAIVVFTGVMLLMGTSQYGILGNFYADNAKVVPSQYAGYYANLTANQDSLTTTGNDMAEKSLLGVALDIGGSFFSLLQLGLSAISTLAKTPDYIMGISSTLKQSTGLPEPLFWMLTTVVVILCAALLIKAKRNQVDLP